MPSVLCYNDIDTLKSHENGPVQNVLNPKAPITTAADYIHKYFFIVFFSNKIRLDVSRESSARQRIHMKNQALFSSKDKSI